MAAEELAPLAEKLQTAEAISIDDFTKIFDMVKNAMADGRLSIMEAVRIGLAVFALIKEITDSPTSDTNFGF